MVDAFAVGAEGVVRALEVDGEAALVEDVVDAVLQVPLGGHDAQHLEEVVQGILDAVVRLEDVVHHRVDGLEYAELVWQLTAAGFVELLEEVDAQQHRREVLPDADGHLAPVEERPCYSAGHLQVGGEVTAQTELDVPEGEEDEVHGLELPVRLLVAGLPFQRRLLGVGGDDALEQRGLGGARLASDADGGLQVVGIHLRVRPSALLCFAPVEAA